MICRYDSTTFHVKPDKVTLTMKETETFFLFEMPQLTADLDTPEGQAVKAANEAYEYITVGAGSNRKLVNAETQTPRVHTKSRSTYIGRQTRENRGTYVNNWVMHDTYAALETGIDGETLSRTVELQVEFLIRSIRIYHKILFKKSQPSWILFLSQNPKTKIIIMNEEFN